QPPPVPPLPPGPPDDIEEDDDNAPPALPPAATPPPIPPLPVSAPPPLPPIVDEKKDVVTGVVSLELPPTVDDREVVIVEESSWQIELSRPARLSVVGWMASGDVEIGNHREAAVIIPENRATPKQRFAPRDYFSVFVRGRRSRLTLLDTDEARLESEGVDVDETTDGGALLEIVRRDGDGEPDFEVPLRLRAERMLPDPRARMLALDTDDAMVTALFTLGLPLRSPRQLHIGQLELSARYDGERIVISDYLDSYQGDGGFSSFFVRHGESPFRTAPEDGSAITLEPGDLLLIGVAIYRFDHG
ncbi:MAG: hypothetical protein ACI8S6_002850, partial [Myxococcota bacterium]